MKLTIVDLALKAASMCHFCRQGERPIDDSSQDQGDVFVHKIGNGKTGKCDADQLWVVIRGLEAKMK